MRLPYTHALLSQKTKPTTALLGVTPPMQITAKTLAKHGTLHSIHDTRHRNQPNLEQHSCDGLPVVTLFYTLAKKSQPVNICQTSTDSATIYKHLQGTSSLLYTRTTDTTNGPTNSHFAHLVPYSDQYRLMRSAQPLA